MRPSTEGNLYSQSRAKSNNSCTPKEITPYEVYHHPEEWCSALFLRNSKIKSLIISLYFSSINFIGHHGYVNLVHVITFTGSSVTNLKKIMS